MNELHEYLSYKSFEMGLEFFIIRLRIGRKFMWSLVSSTYPHLLSPSSTPSSLPVVISFSFPSSVRPLVQVVSFRVIQNEHTD